jgi:hypothetical protein
MVRMSLTAARFVITVALSGAGAACQNAQAEELASRVRFLYSGSLSTMVEQPEAEAECGEEQVTYESSGYLSIDREEPSARLDGFGCSIAYQVHQVATYLQALSLACLLAPSTSGALASSGSTSRASPST